METKLSYSLSFPLDSTTRYNAPQLLQQTAEELGWLIEQSNANQWSIFAPNCQVTIKADVQVVKIVFEAIGIANEEQYNTIEKQLELFTDRLKNASTAMASEMIEEMQESAAQKAKNFFMLFVPTRELFITPLLIDINILIFIIMAFCGMNVFLPDNEFMIQWGANFAPTTIKGEWWRLFTSLFLHFGILHLLMNMYALVYIGVLLEPLIGKLKFLIVYLIAGLAASTCSLWWYDFTISAGASGAVFGMYGVFIALLLSGLTNFKDKKGILVSMLLFVGFNLLNGVKGGIDNAAHIGGLVGGTLIGLTIAVGIRTTTNRAAPYAILSGLFLITGFMAFRIYTTKPDIMAIYQTKLDKIVSMESMASELLQMPQSTSQEEYLHELKTRSLYYTEECLHFTDTLLAMNLPPAIQERNKLMKEYFSLRKEYYELVYKAMSEDNMKAYEPAMQEILTRVNQKMKMMQ